VAAPTAYLRFSWRAYLQLLAPPPYARRPEAQPDFGTSRDRRAFGDALNHIKHRFLRFEPLTWAPTHRDFSPEHLILEGRRFTGLDFDEFCQYDPLFDVAHFVAHLRFLALVSSGAIHSLDALAARFEDSYASESACFSVSRLRLFAAIAYLKLAYVEAVVRRNRDGKHVVDALLEEAGRFAESEN